MNELRLHADSDRRHKIRSRLVILESTGHKSEVFLRNFIEEESVILPLSCGKCGAIYNIFLICGDAKSFL